jgi:hypothetical protein
MVLNLKKHCTYYFTLLTNRKHLFGRDNFIILKTCNNSVLIQVEISNETIIRHLLYLYIYNNVKFR